MSLRLVLLRHAETDWNRERRYQGWRDIPLSDTGRGQAEAAGRLLAAEPLAAVWASPLRRARDTAAAIATAQGLPVRVADAFREMRFGQWEGLTADEARSRFPELHRAWAEAPHDVALPGAETLAEVKARAIGGLAELRQAHDGQRVCLVSHGITCRILILEALGLGLDRMWSLQLSSTGISELEFRDDWAAVHRMNTLVHLERLPAGR
ncbi:MAG TPA: histidine phosphatase family protein [Candidatus Methylomirabilis sp.]|nr:histidine phosphatase family protein [Candidatus Methylomirabilis sp.]